MTLAKFGGQGMPVELSTESDTDRARDDHGPAIPQWLTLAFFVLFLAAVARHGTRAISDPDAFWHLRLGRDIIETRSLHDITDSWSAISNQPWVPTQWLTEVVVALAEDLGGLPAVAWLFTLTLLALTLLIHRLCRRWADSLPAAFATALTIAAMSASLSPRPHMLTYIFLAVTLIGWHRTIVDLTPRWWLIPMTWVWAMCHGMWFVGPIVGLAVVLGLLLDGRSTRGATTRLLAIPICSVVAASLTPVGPSLLGAPFAVAGIGGFITEWQPPSFRSPSPAAAALMVTCVVVIWSRANRPVPWTNITMLAVAVGWILVSGRTVALGALVMAPLVAAGLQSMLGQAPRTAPRLEVGTLRFAAVAICAVVAAVVPSTASQPAGVPSQLNPELDALGESVVFNSYELGGWLRWRHPDLEPVVDGMTEAYSVNHLTTYGMALAVSPEWIATLEKWNVDAALLPDESSLTFALIEQRGWVVVKQDAGYTLLTPNDADRESGEG